MGERRRRKHIVDTCFKGQWSERRGRDKGGGDRKGKKKKKEMGITSEKSTRGLKERKIEREIERERRREEGGGRKEEEERERGAYHLRPTQRKRGKREEKKKWR